MSNHLYKYANKIVKEDTQAMKKQTSHIKANTQKIDQEWFGNGNLSINRMNQNKTPFSNNAVKLPIEFTNDVMVRQNTNDLRMYFNNSSRGDSPTTAASKKKVQVNQNATFKNSTTEASGVECSSLDFGYKIK